MTPGEAAFAYIDRTSWLNNIPAAEYRRLTIESAYHLWPAFLRKTPVLKVDEAIKVWNVHWLHAVIGFT